jgi:hypothetical protein
MSIVYILPNRSGGFFNNLWIMSSNYLYAKKYELDFYVDDRQWTFKHTHGWRDYFTSLKCLDMNTEIKYPIHKQLDVEDARLEEFTLNDYRNIFKEIFIFTPELNERLEKQMTVFELNNEYSSIMIRRGDKMYGESYYINTEEYVDVLVDKPTACILVQTDDYRAYTEVCTSVNMNSINSRIVTTCPTTKLGSFVFNYVPQTGSNKSSKNNDYLLSLSDISQVAIVNLKSTEIKEHVEEMLIGLKICLDSKYLSTDIQSNVTRFLVCNHSNLSGVCLVQNDKLPDFNICVKCPAKGFIVSN